MAGKPESLKIKGTSVLGFDPKRKRYVKIGTKIGEWLFKEGKNAYFMRIVNGYGIQYDAFNYFPSVGIKHISILQGPEGNTWESETMDWFRHGKVADYGHGKQYFLSLKYMRLKDKERIAATYEAKERERDIVKQRLLF